MKLCTPERSPFDEREDIAILVFTYLEERKNGYILIHILPCQSQIFSITPFPPCTRQGHRSLVPSHRIRIDSHSSAFCCGRNIWVVVTGSIRLHLLRLSIFDSVLERERGRGREKRGFQVMAKGNKSISTCIHSFIYLRKIFDYWQYVVLGTPFYSMLQYITKEPFIF